LRGACEIRWVFEGDASFTLVCRLTIDIWQWKKLPFDRPKSCTESQKP